VVVIRPGPWVCGAGEKSGGDVWRAVEQHGGIGGCFQFILLIHFALGGVFAQHSRANRPRCLSFLRFFGLAVIFRDSAIAAHVTRCGVPRMGASQVVLKAKTLTLW
jgi:hypothetical protein